MWRPIPGISLWILIFLPAIAFAGQPLLQHFTVDNGLPSNTVYNVMQDSRGFLWVCTDHGVCRYDGHEFISYTLEQGLPDMEIFNAAEDADKRLWLVCYNKKPCYILNDKIYNASNDYLCRQMERNGADYTYLLFNNNRELFCFGGNNAWYVHTNSLQHFDASEDLANASYHFTDANASYFSTRKGLAISQGKGLKYLLTFTKDLESIYSLVFYQQDHHLVFMSNGLNDKVTTYRLHSDSLKLLHEQSFQYRTYSAQQDNDSILLLSTHTGLVKYNLHTGETDTANIILKNIPITHSLKDREGNYWFSTLTDGLYAQAHQVPLIQNKENGLSSNNVQSLFLTPSGLLMAGTNNGTIDIIQNNGISTVRLMDKEKSSFRIARLFAAGNNTFIACCDRGLYKIQTGQKALPVKRYNAQAIKAIDTSNGKYFVGTASSCYTIDIRTDNTSILWNTKTTALASGKDKALWLGTIKGVFKYSGDTIRKFNADSLLSQSNITDIKRLENDRMVFATQQYGIFLLDGNGLSRISTSGGLSDNSCKRIFGDKNGNLWVCTNKGLDKVIFSSGKPSYTIRHFSQSDGLPVKNINDVIVKDQMIYIATSEGIITLKDQKETDTIPPPVFITAVQTPDSAYNGAPSLTFSYRQNTLQISYTGISLCGGNDINYKYLLSGGNASATYTRSASVNFSALKPGSYTFSVWARKKGGQWSLAPARFSFTIKPPFWQTYWFAGMVLLVAGSSIFYLYKSRIKTVTEQEAEKTLLNKRMTELEMQALRAQINPHFVFNALNSIQHYYSRNDEISANEYMTSFARLIRQTFTYAQTHWISLAEETEILSTYISLEQMRYKNSFTWEITSAPGIDTDAIKIPAMLVQPYVENAIGHGLRHLSGGGKLLVDFSLLEREIICTIQDNGTGFPQSVPTDKDKIHQSRGMDITAKRIETINQLYNTHIQVKIYDLQQENTLITGTRVEISIPIKTTITT